MRVLVTGDRNWTNRNIMQNAIDSLAAGDVVVEGEARGADSMSREIARFRGLQVDKYPAKWDVYGRSAGPIRNQEMLDTNPDEVWAFHQNLAESRGTLDMVRRAQKKGIKVKYFFEPTVFNIRKLPSTWMTLPDVYAYIGRKGHGQVGTWGNPVVRGVQCPACGRTHMDNGQTLPCYEAILHRNLDHNPLFLEPLRGKHLVCFCAPSPCHGDVILTVLGG